MSLMDDDKGGVRVKPFRGDPEEWPNWKRKFRAFLGTKKLLIYLGTTASPGQEEAWNPYREYDDLFIPSILC